MNLSSHKELEVWKNAMALVIDVYRLTADFPAYELYGLSSQIRRAGVSIVSNISEGAARQTTKEFIQFLYTARGSASEVETQLLISKELEYSKPDTIGVLLEKVNAVSKQLSTMINSLKQRL